MKRTALAAQVLAITLLASAPLAGCAETGAAIGDLSRPGTRVAELGGGRAELRTSDAPESVFSALVAELSAAGGLEATWSSSRIAVGVHGEARHYCSVEREDDDVTRLVVEARPLGGLGRGDLPARALAEAVARRLDG